MQGPSASNLCQAARELHVRPPLPQLDSPSVLLSGASWMRGGRRPLLMPPLVEEGLLEQLERSELRTGRCGPQALPNPQAQYSDPDARVAREAARAGAVVAARAAVVAAHDAGARLGLQLPGAAVGVAAGAVAGAAVGAAAGEADDEGMGEGSGDVRAGRRATHGRRLLERLTQSLHRPRTSFRPRPSSHNRPSLSFRAASARWPPRNAFRHPRDHPAGRGGSNRPVSVPANYRLRMRLRRSEGAQRRAGDRRGSAVFNQSSERQLDWLTAGALKLWRRFDRRVRPRVRLRAALSRLREVLLEYIAFLPEALTSAAERAASVPGFHLASLPLMRTREIPVAASSQSSRPLSLAFSPLSSVTCAAASQRQQCHRQSSSTTESSPRGSPPSSQRTSLASGSPRLVLSPIHTSSQGFSSLWAPFPRRPQSPSQSPTACIPRPVKRSVSQQCPSPPPHSYRQRSYSHNSSPQKHLSRCSLQPLPCIRRKSVSSFTHPPPANNQFTHQKPLSQSPTKQSSSSRPSNPNLSLLPSLPQPIESHTKKYSQSGYAERKDSSSHESSGKALFIRSHKHVLGGTVEIPPLRLPSPPSPSAPSSFPPTPSPTSLSPTFQDVSHSISYTQLAVKTASLLRSEKMTTSTKAPRVKRANNTANLLLSTLKEQQQTRKSGPRRHKDRKRPLGVGDWTTRLSGRKSGSRSCRRGERKRAFSRGKGGGGGKKPHRSSVKPGERLFLIHLHLLAMQERRERLRQQALSIEPRRAFSALPATHEALDMELAEGEKPISALMRLMAWSDAGQRRRRSKRKRTKRSPVKKTSTREVATSATPAHGKAFSGSQKLNEMQSHSEKQLSACPETHRLSKALSDTFNGKENEKNRLRGNISHLPIHAFKCKDNLNLRERDMLFNKKKTNINESSNVSKNVPDICAIGERSNKHSKPLNVLGAVLVVGPANINKKTEEGGKVSTLDHGVTNTLEADEKGLIEHPLSIEVGVKMTPYLRSSDIRSQNIDETKIKSVVKVTNRTQINGTDATLRPQFKSEQKSRSKHCKESQQDVRQFLLDESSDIAFDGHVAKEYYPKKLRNLRNEVQLQSNRNIEISPPVLANPLNSISSKYNSLSKISAVNTHRPRISRHKRTDIRIGSTKVQCNENVPLSTPGKERTDSICSEVPNHFRKRPSPSKPNNKIHFDELPSRVYPYDMNWVDGECSRSFISQDSDIEFSEKENSRKSSNSIYSIADRRNRKLTYNVSNGGRPLSMLPKSIDNRTTDSLNRSSEDITRYACDRQINHGQNVFVSTQSPILFDDSKSGASDIIADKVSNELMSSCENVMCYGKKLVTSGSNLNNSFKFKLPKSMSVMRSCTDSPEAKCSHHSQKEYMGYKNIDTRSLPSEDSPLIYNGCYIPPTFQLDHAKVEQSKVNSIKSMGHIRNKISDSDDESHQHQRHKRSEYQGHGYRTTNKHKRPSQALSHNSSQRKQRTRTQRSVSFQRYKGNCSNESNRSFGAYHFATLSPARDNSVNRSHDSCFGYNALNNIKYLQTTDYNLLYERNNPKTEENKIDRNPSSVINSLNMPIFNHHHSSSSSTYSQMDEYGYLRFCQRHFQHFCDEELKPCDTPQKKPLVRNVHSRANSETIACIRKCTPWNSFPDVFPQRSITCLMVSPDTPPRLPSTPKSLPLRKGFVNSPDPSAGRSTYSSAYPNSTLPSSVVRTPTSSIVSSKKCLHTEEDVIPSQNTVTKQSIPQIGAPPRSEKDLDDSDPGYLAYVPRESSFLPCIPLGGNCDNMGAVSASQNAILFTSKWQSDPCIMSETNVSSSAYYEQYVSLPNDIRELTPVSRKYSNKHEDIKMASANEKNQSKLTLCEQALTFAELNNPLVEDPDQQYHISKISPSSMLKHVIENEFTISGSSDICPSSDAQSIEVTSETYSMCAPSVKVVHPHCVHGATSKDRRDLSCDSNQSSQPVASSALDDFPEDPPSTPTEVERDPKRNVKKSADQNKTTSKSRTVTPLATSHILSTGLRHIADYKALVTCLDNHATMMRDIGLSRGIENIPERPPSASLGDRNINRQEYMKALRQHLQLVRAVCPRVPEEKTVDRPSMAALLLM